MHLPNITYNRSTSGAIKRAQTPRRHEGSTCKEIYFELLDFPCRTPLQKILRTGLNMIICLRVKMDLKKKIIVFHP